MKTIIDAGWKLKAAQPQLPPAQVVHKEQLETQDWTENAYDGGTLRLFVSSGNNNDIFALVVDTREPKYAGFMQPMFAEHYHAYREGPYVVVVPVHPVSQQLFDTLKAKLWTEEELERQLGSPSLHWHVHGIGWDGRDYIGQGLSFIGDIRPLDDVAGETDSHGDNTPSTDVPTPTKKYTDVYMYGFHDGNVEETWEQQGHDMDLPPASAFAGLDYAVFQRDVRESLSTTLVKERREIDQALTTGTRAPDGRSVVGTVDFGGLGYSTELVVRETGWPERRYRPPSQWLGKYLWLNNRTLLVEGYEAAMDTQDLYTLDARDGAVTSIEKVPYDSSAKHRHSGLDLNISGPDKFWYTTGDGKKHEVTVSNSASVGSMTDAVADENPTAEIQPTPSPGVIESLAPAFDEHQWTVVQAIGASFGTEHPGTLVQLLKSISTPYENGMDQPVHGVNLIVVENGRLLYSFLALTLPSSKRFPDDHVAYMDDGYVSAGPPLEVRDVTGDGVPEIIFHSGVAGASDFGTDIHVLHYDKVGHFHDIRDDQFFESKWQRFRWVDLNGTTVALVAVAVEPEDPDLTCHLCPKFHKYDIYRWNSSEGKFMVVQAIPSTGKLHGDEDWLQVDWPYIMEHLGSAR